MARDGSAFEKDFGYLIPFLDRVSAAISQLPDAAAREEGARLLAGEKEKWQRLRQLLKGAQGSNHAPLRPAPQQSQPSGAGSGAPRANPAPAPQTGLTVGSLKTRR